MKVLFITKHSLRVESGGVAVVLDALSERLTASGIEVAILGCHPSAQVGVLPNGIACHWAQFPTFGLFQQGRLRRIAKHCRQLNIDLIHAHSVYRAGEVARRLKSMLGTPYVLTSHGDIMRDASSRLNRPRVRRRCAKVLNSADAVTHLTATMADHAESLAPVRDKSSIIPNGVYLSQWREQTDSLPGNYIFTLGRHEPEKGFHVLLAAYKVLADRGHDVALVIAGTGPSTEDLHECARRLGLQVCHDLNVLGGLGRATVCFPGRVSEATKRALFTGCRFGVFPSQDKTPESFGIVQIEAMAAGKALVVGDIPATGDLVTPGKNAEVVPAADRQRWAEAMEKLLTDEAVRQAYESANILEARKYDWSHIAARYAEVYRRAAAGG